MPVAPAQRGPPAAVWVAQPTVLADELLSTALVPRRFASQLRPNRLCNAKAASGAVVAGPERPYRMRFAMRLLTQPRSYGYVAVSGDWRRSERNNVWPEAIQGVAANGISPEQAVDEAIARLKRDAQRAALAVRHQVSSWATSRTPVSISGARVLQYLPLDLAHYGNRSSTAAWRAKHSRPKRVLQIAACGAVLALRPDRPEAAAPGIEDAAEHRVGIEAPERAPVDAAVAADERRAMAVTDPGMVADRPVARLGHALAHAAAAGQGRRLVHRELLARGPAPENRPAAPGPARGQNSRNDTRSHPSLPERRSGRS
jgi:hypothetical protein